MSDVYQDALLRPVRYRGVDINHVDELTDGQRRGYLLEELDFSQVQSVGYTEKRAQDDGMDASDVYLGMRVVRVGGQVYGSGPGDLQDQLQTLRTIFTATVAYAADKANYGFLPLEFELPTADPQFGTGTPIPGFRPLEIRARPRGQPTFMLRRDVGQGVGNNPAGGGVIAYQAVLECRDPRLYVRPYKDLPFGIGGSYTVVNRGDYPAPLDVLIFMPAIGGPKTVRIRVGGVDMSIVVPDELVDQTLRYSGTLKVLTQEMENVEKLRMDLLTFAGDDTNPVVPPGSNTVTIEFAGGMGTGTRLMWNESFA